MDRRILIALAIGILIVGSGLYLKKEFFPVQDNIAITEIEHNTISNSNSWADSDSDSLKDWEEILWKSDPKKADTDGDGTLDGEEVRLGRNPLKKAPGDELTDNDTVYPKIEDPETVLVPYPEESSSPKPEIPPSKPVLAVDQEPLHIFGNTLGEVMWKKMAEYSTEMKKMDGYAKNPSVEAATYFKNLAVSYENVGKNIKNITAPSEAENVKEKLAASFQGIASALSGIIVGSDGKITAGLDVYTQAIVTYSNTFVAARNFFVSKKITYTETEYGIMFTRTF